MPGRSLAGWLVQRKAVEQWRQVQLLPSIRWGLGVKWRNKLRDSLPIRDDQTVVKSLLSKLSPNALDAAQQLAFLAVEFLGSQRAGIAEASQLANQFQHVIGRG